MLSGKKLLLKLLFLVVYSQLQAQIFVPTADDSITAKNGDKVAVFTRPFYNADLNASVIAVSVDGLDDWTFQWSVYSPADSAYIDIPAVQNGRTAQIDTITVNSGYLVQITRGLEIDTFRIWVVINDLDVMITNKDDSDTILFGYYNCSSLDLRADTAKPPGYYYDPSTHVRIAPANIYVTRWTTNNPEAAAPAGRLLTRVNNPPWADTWYKITITDSYGLRRSDSAVYKSIQSKADIKDNPEYIPLTDPEVYPQKDWYEKFYEYPGSISAPAVFEFDLTNSRNLVNYMLNFGDGDSLTLGNDSLMILHEFRKPGEYKIRLTTKSARPFECISVDTTTVSIDYASEANFSMPNVFTPSNSKNTVFKPVDEAINNVFRTTDVSVIYIDIVIFSRTGLKVHKFEGNIRDWSGWDGFIMNSGREAPEGVYFYVISRLDAYHTEIDTPINKKLLKGFIHLYREQ